MIKHHLTAAVLLLASPFLLADEYLYENVVFKFGLDEIADGTVVDSGTRGYVGVVEGTPIVVEGLKGNALYFGEESGYIDVSMDNFDATNFTVSYRLQPEVTTNYNQQMGAGWGAFQQHTNKNGGVYVGTEGPTKLQPGGFDSTSRYVVGEWQHVTVTFDGETLSYYKDGNLERAEYQPVGASWARFRIGDKTVSKSIFGTLDELVVYDIALTQEQVTDLHNFVEIDFPLKENLSNLWGFEGELWSSNSRLPFVALAGYAEGKEPIPSDLPIVANILDFGAVGAYDLETMTPEQLDAISDADTQALFAAIAHAESIVTADNMGMVYLPNGDYLINDRISLIAPGLVLSGESREGSTLRFWGASLVERGYDIRAKWIDMGNHVSWQRWNYLMSHQLDPDNMPSRGDLVIKLGTPMRDEMYDMLIEQGSRVLLSQSLNFGEYSETPELAKNTHLTSNFALIDSRGGANIKQQLVIEVAEDRQTLTLDRPLRFTPTAETLYGGASIGVRSTPETDSVNMGIQNLSLLFPSTDWTSHGGTGGNGAINVFAENSWIQNLYLLNADNGIELDKFTANITVRNIIIDSDRVPRRSGPSGGRYDTHGHHGSTIRGYDNLFENVQLLKSYHHDITMVNCQACIVSKSGGVEFDMDHHRQFTYSSVWTEINVGDPVKLWYSTGNASEGARAAAYHTFWNIHTDNASQVQWPEDEPNATRQGWGYHHINMIGTQVPSVPAVGDGKRPFPYDGLAPHFEAIQPDVIYPQNIYEAQKVAYQTGKLKGLENPNLEYTR